MAARRWWSTGPSNPSRRADDHRSAQLGGAALRSVDNVDINRIGERFRRIVTEQRVRLPESNSSRGTDGSGGGPLGLLPPGWECSTLGAVCERGGGNIQTGPFGSQLHASDYRPVGIPSIMPQNLGDNRVIVDGIARIGDRDASRLRRYLVRKGDIVYSRRGDVEKRALIGPCEDGWLCGTGCLRVRPGRERCRSRICLVLLGTPRCSPVDRPPCPWRDHAEPEHGDTVCLPIRGSAHFRRVRLFFVEDFSPYSWALLPANASLQWPFRGGTSSRPARAGVFPAASRASRRRTPSVFSPTGALPSGHSRGVLVRCRGKGGRPAMAVTTGFQGTYIRRAPNRRPLHRSPEASPVRSGRCCLRGCQSLPLVQRSPADERERTRNGNCTGGARSWCASSCKDIATNAARKRLLVRPRARAPAVSSARSRASTKATPKRPPARCRLWVWAARGAVTTACIGSMPR